MLELYKRIKHRREELNMTQDALAKKVGYKSRTSIHKIELGMTDLPQSKIMEIADALATTPEYLMGWTSKTTKRVNNTEPELAEDETKLVADYRWLDADGKNLVLNMIRRLRGVPVVNDVSKHNSDNGSNYGVVGGNFNSQVTIG